MDPEQAALDIRAAFRDYRQAARTEAEAANERIRIMDRRAALLALPR